MADFPLHTLDTAPAQTRDKLEAVQSKMGFIPNLFDQLAEAPAALEAYLALNELLGKTSFSPAEQQVLVLSIAVENRCEFCVAAHSGGAKKAGVPEAVIEALRNRRDVPDTRLAALADFAQAVVRERGWVAEDEVESFLEAGFTKQNVFEVILGVSLKTLSNYSNHIAGTPLNPELSSFAWSTAK